MSDDLTIPAGERGVIRIFALDLPDEQARFLREPGAAQQVLGAEGLDDAHIDIIRLDDLEEVGLNGYLIDGLGVPKDQINPDWNMLGALTGYVMILRSSAFSGQPMTLHPDPGVRLVATYHEPGTDWSATPMTTDSAKPFSAAKPPPRAARAEARKIGAILFAVVMTLIVLGILWIVL